MLSTDNPWLRTSIKTNEPYINSMSLPSYKNFFLNTAKKKFQNKNKKKEQQKLKLYK